MLISATPNACHPAPVVDSFYAAEVTQVREVVHRERESELERKFAIDLIPQTLKND